MDVAACPFGVGRLEMHSGAATKARSYACRITCSLHQCHALFEQLQRGARISLVKVVAALIQRLSQDSHRMRFSRGPGHGQGTGEAVPADRERGR